MAAFNRDANPKLQSPLVSVGYLHDIVGADAVIAGKARTISGVRALGPYTLQIRTTRLLPDLVSRLAMPFFCPIAVSTPLTEIENPLGSGPYYIASRVPNRQVVLERNRFYRGSRPANVDRRCPDGRAGAGGLPASCRAGPAGLVRVPLRPGVQRDRRQVRDQQA